MITVSLEPAKSQARACSSPFLHSQKGTAEENEIAVVEKQLAHKVKENIDKGQREYYLREKLKAIQSELGTDEDVETESVEWLEKLDKLKLDKKTNEKIRKEIGKFAKMMPNSAESSVIRNYVETILELP